MSPAVDFDCPLSSSHVDQAGSEFAATLPFL